MALNEAQMNQVFQLLGHCVWAYNRGVAINARLQQGQMTSLAQTIRSANGAMEVDRYFAFYEPFVKELDNARANIEQLPSQANTAVETFLKGKVAELLAGVDGDSTMIQIGTALAANMVSLSKTILDDGLLDTYFKTVWSINLITAASNPTYADALVTN